MLYRRIRELREDNDISQWQIAEAIGIKQRTYSNYENGVYKIPPEVLTALALYHSTSVDFLLGITDVQEPYPISDKNKK